MAKNLASKIEPTDKLLVYDRNKESSSKLLQEVGAAASNGRNVEVASSVREVAEKSVSQHAQPSPSWSAIHRIPL